MSGNQPIVREDFKTDLVVQELPALGQDYFFLKLIAFALVGVAAATVCLLFLWLR